MINVKEILAEVFKIDIDKIPNNVKIGDLPGWDSLGHIRLVLYIEKLLKRPIETEEIIKIINIENIKTILNNNKNDRGVESNDQNKKTKNICRII